VLLLLLIAILPPYSDEPSLEGLISHFNRSLGLKVIRLASNNWHILTVYKILHIALEFSTIITIPQKSQLIIRKLG
jgi:hypothetical protein